MYYKHKPEIVEYNKTASLEEQKCIQCGKTIGADSLLGEVCLKCCKKNHKEAVGEK